VIANLAAKMCLINCGKSCVSAPLLLLPVQLTSDKVKVVCLHQTTCLQAAAWAQPRRTCPQRLIQGWDLQKAALSCKTYQMLIFRTWCIKKHISGVSLGASLGPSSRIASFGWSPPRQKEGGKGGGLP